MSFSAKLLFRFRRHSLPLLLSALRRAYWRTLGMQVGRNTRIAAGLTVTWPHRVSLGNNCSLEHGIYLNAAGAYKPGVAITLGDGTFVGSHCEFNSVERVQLGRNCLIASGTRFIDHDHGLELGATIKAQQENAAPILLGSDVWVGANSIILKGVTVGDGAVIAAGSVVTRSVPPHAIVAGVPARIVRNRSADLAVPGPKASSEEGSSTLSEATGTIAPSPQG